MLTRQTPDAQWLAAPPPAPARWAREKSRANGAASWRAPLVEQEQGQDLAVDRAQAMLPGRHLALASLINRLVDRADVATIDPALVRQVRRAELLAAASLLAVADDAVGREHLAPAGDGSGPAFGPGRIGQRLRIVGNGQHRVGIEDAVAAERHHLRSEEHTSELQSLMRNSYAVFCLKKKNSTI